MQIGTIITCSHLPRARVLARSHRAHHQDGRCVALVIDDTEGRIDSSAEPFDVVTPEQAGINDLDERARTYDPVELACSLKPQFLRWLLEVADTVLYLDSDVEIFASLVPLEEATRRHGLVLTPNHTAPIPQDGHRPTQDDILRAGIYNGGFLGVSRSGDSLRVLDWLSELLRTECRVDTARERFVDQRWLDLVPALATDLHIERDPGYNVAGWNLQERALTKGAEGILVNGRPLRFFHFSGYSPDRPDQLSVHQTRNDLSDPVLRGLLDSYRAKLIDNGWEQTRAWPYGLGRPARPQVSPAERRRASVEGARMLVAGGLPADEIESLGPIRRVLHRFALRLLSPQTAFERNADLATIDAVEELRRSFEGLDSRISALTERVDRLEGGDGPATR